MGKIWMTGGSSTDLDSVNAENWQILQNRVIVDKNGNPLVGTMPDRAAINPIINAGERFPIPVGYHNGLGGVTANSLAAQTPGNLQSNVILSPYYGYSNGVRVQGNIATMGAQTISPTSYQQTVQTAGKYLSGNVTVNGVYNLRPENVRKGVQVGDIVGIAEGYYPTANDLYLRGNNIAGFTAGSSDTKFESGGIKVNDDYLILYSNTQIDFTPYNYLNVELYYEKIHTNLQNVATRNLSMGVGLRNSSNVVLAQGNTSSLSANNTYVVSVSLFNVSLATVPRIRVGVEGQYWYTGNDGDQWTNIVGGDWTGWVYRVWLS